MQTLGRLFGAAVALALVTRDATAAAGEIFDTASAVTSCAANTFMENANTKLACAATCSLAGSCLSFSHANGTCVLSDSPYRTTSDAAIVFRRRVSGPSYPNPGYEQQIGGRRFWVFQQRQTGAVNFNRTWDEYERGFGDANEFWSGLQLIRSYSQSSCSRTLRMELTTHLDGVLRVAEWLDFSISDASNKYTINCGAMSLNSGFGTDPMYSHRGMKFSTIDRDNDNAGGSCSQLYGNGGFWFNACLVMNPNGWYTLVDHSADAGASKYGFMCTYAIGDCKPLRAARIMLQL